MLILGIESSCDETAAAVVENGRKVYSDNISSQVDEHKKFGGVVPEIASRRHCENIYGVVKAALEKANVTMSDIDAIGVTYAPGLIGALLVGTSFAKGLAMTYKKPLIPVHHIAGHIASNYIAHPDLEPPFLCLAASGGHTLTAEVLSYTKFRIIGRTRDDAAGEAFDKAARVLGYSYPGGVHIDKAAQKGDPHSYKLPRPTVAGNEYDFSFSGLKTAVINTVHNAAQKHEEIVPENMAASFQYTVSEILSERTIQAAHKFGYTKIAAAGGVSANSGLRKALSEKCGEYGYKLYLPPLSLCGDNGSMIGAQAYYDYLDGKTANESLNALAVLPIG